MKGEEGGCKRGEERASAGEVQKNRPLQQLVCHLKSFPSQPFDIEMKQCVTAGGCWPN